MSALILFFLSLFPLIEETIPEGPFLYRGKAPREVLVIDPGNSPLLDLAIERLLELLPNPCTELEVIETTHRFIREELFDRENSSPEAISHLIQIEEEIPLERFLEERMGICRHFALTTTLLLDRLTKIGKIEGTAMLIREETPFGRHGWTLFLTETSAWHVDPYLDILKDGKNEKDFLSLCQKYGKRTMEKQKVRWCDGNRNPVF